MHTLLPIGVLLMICQLTFALLSNPRASYECKQIHKAEVPIADFLNNGCKLMCAVNNQVVYHAFQEGNHCPGLSGTADYYKKVCRNGDCITGSSGGSSEGNIEIVVVNGNLPDMDPVINPKPDGYVMTCIQADHGPINRPLSNKSGCDCKTNIIQDNNNPVWNYRCTNWSRTQKFKNDTRIIFEAWDDDSPLPDDFIGSASVTITELIHNQKNGIQQEFIIYKNRNNVPEKHGAISVNIKWTPVF